MILPISKAFNSLKTRLDCISNTYGGSFELPLAVSTKSKGFFFGEDYKIAGTIDEAKQSPGFISVEECLNYFDERLVQCQEYFREKLIKEQQRQISSSNASQQLHMRRYAHATHA
jgi:hypothetical protein